MPRYLKSITAIGWDLDGLKAEVTWLEPTSREERIPLVGGGFDVIDVPDTRATTVTQTFTDEAHLRDYARRHDLD